MKCIAITTRKTPCGNDAVEGDLLCPLHLRVVAGLDHDPHVDGPVEKAVTPLRILATHGKQDPLVATVFWASDGISEGRWDGNEQRMGLDVALDLAERGGALPDLERLVAAGAVPDWTIGYWRAGGYPTERVEPAYVETDSGLIEVLPSLAGTPAGG